MQVRFTHHAVPITPDAATPFPVSRTCKPAVSVALRRPVKLPVWNRLFSRDHILAGRLDMISSIVLLLGVIVFGLIAAACIEVLLELDGLDRTD
jgi:hypothetical protein